MYIVDLVSCEHNSLILNSKVGFQGNNILEGETSENQLYLTFLTSHFTIIGNLPPQFKIGRMDWPTLVLSPNIMHMIHTKIIAMHFLGRVMLHLDAWWNIKFSFQYCYNIIIYNIILDGNKTGDDDAMWSNNIRINEII